VKAATIILVFLSAGGLALSVHFPPGYGDGARFIAGAMLGLEGGWLLARWFKERE
jgi:hypothetical protein